MENNSIIITRSNGEVRRFDISVILTAEARIPEIASVTPTKAPELLSVFNVAYLEAARLATFLEAEVLQSKRNADKIRSVVILDRAPAILEAKGLTSSKNRAGSEDLRKSVLDGDTEYQDALEKTGQIECIHELIKTKTKGLEMAYSSVKKVLGENAYNFRNPNLNGGGEESPASKTGFGRSNYSR
jgi:hypothetical protein